MPAREDLVNATKELLWEKGYAAMSPGDILKRSGAGHGSLYHHFSGKEEIARATLKAVEEDLSSRAQTLLAAPTPALERLENYLFQKRDALRGCRLGRMAFDPGMNEALRGPVTEYFEGLHKMVVAVIKEAQSDGGLKESLNPDRTAAALVAAVQGGYVLSKAHNDPTKMRDAVTGIADLLGL